MFFNRRSQYLMQRRPFSCLFVCLFVCFFFCFFFLLFFFFFFFFFFVVVVVVVFKVIKFTKLWYYDSWSPEIHHTLFEKTILSDSYFLKLCSHCPDFVPRFTSV